jgi:large subunit ribosomal protein L29
MASGPNQAAAQLRELVDDELVVKLRESKEELFNLRFQSATGQLQSNHRLRGVRTDIARIYTVLRERELGIAVAPVVSPASEKAKSEKAKTVKAKPQQAESEKAESEKAEPEQTEQAAAQVEDKAIEKDEVKA